MRHLAYQDKVLKALDAYIDVLKAKKTEADEIAKLAEKTPFLKGHIPDFAKEAWEALQKDVALKLTRQSVPYSARIDGTGKPVPNAVLKVPTGGGKTYLAINGLSRIFGRWLNKNTGFVLWIVPNEAIYSQTLKRLKDRQDPIGKCLTARRRGACAFLKRQTGSTPATLKASFVSCC